MACTFQATIGGKFAPLVGLRDEDMDINTMITTYNTAVTYAASEILGKECHMKKPWVTKDVLNLCDERRDLKKRYEAEGASVTADNSVVENWIIDPAARVRFPPKSWDFFQPNLLCFFCSLLRLLCRKMGAHPGLDLILRRNGFILRRNGFQVIINDDFLEEGECYCR